VDIASSSWAGSQCVPQAHQAGAALDRVTLTPCRLTATASSSTSPLCQSSRQQLTPSWPA
jgi:hypothetical protein